MNRKPIKRRQVRAPGSRRKLRILLSMMLGVPLFAILLGSGVFDPPQPPTLRLEYARESIQRAAESGALVYAPEEYRRAEKLVQLGWTEIGRQSGRMSLFRSYHQADSLLIAARDLADACSQNSIDSVASLSKRAREEYLSLETELKNWRESLDGSLTLFDAERYWTDAEMKLTQAKQLAKVGEFEAAFNSVHSGRAALARVGAVISARAEDEAANRHRWRQWVENVIADSRHSGDHAVVVDKSAHKTYLLRAGKVIHTYDCELGYNSARPKLFAGDGATPEGIYRVSKVKNGSKYYRALLLDYPNAQDKARFAENKRKGVISQRAGIGKLIEIHGGGGMGNDWTDGCVALTNNEMDHIMKYIGHGSQVAIVRRYDGFK